MLRWKFKCTYHWPYSVDGNSKSNWEWEEAHLSPYLCSRSSSSMYSICDEDSRCDKFSGISLFHLMFLLWISNSINPFHVDNFSEQSPQNTKTTEIVILLLIYSYSWKARNAQWLATPLYETNVEKYCFEWPANDLKRSQNIQTESISSAGIDCPCQSCAMRSLGTVLY